MNLLIPRMSKLSLLPVLALAMVTVAAIRLRGDAGVTPAGVAVVSNSTADSASMLPAPVESDTVAAGPVFPVASHELSSVVSRFGDARDGGLRPHLGIDIAAPRGTAVLAVADGTVERVDNTPVGGRAVWLREEGSARRHYFAHLESITVSRKQRVRAGQTIGTVGNSGNAAGTSPHLHYAVRSGNAALDPASLFRHRTGGRDSTSQGRIMRTHVGGAALKATPGGVTIAVLPANQPVIVQGEAGRFYRVRYRGKQGYIARWVLEAS